MKKTTVALLIATLPLVSAGCSHSTDASGGEGSQGRPVLGRPTAQTQGQTFNDSYGFDVAGGMGKTAAQQPTGVRDKSYFSESSSYVNEKGAVTFSKRGGPSTGQDQGVRVESSPVAKGERNEQKSVEAEKVKFLMAELQPLSTFSADVDTASYSNLRRALRQSTLPKAESVRVEEMLNYFRYELPAPEGDRPFSVTTELSECPWSTETQLMRVAIKTKDLDRGEAPPRNLVFLLDVSGSMNAPDKLPLLKKSLRTLVDTLDDSDTVSMVVYAGDSGVALPPTSGDQKLKILEAIEQLHAGGSTNGSSGIQLAYELAEQSMDDRSVNRVLLATDGDFNVGVSSTEALKELIEEKRKSGVFLSVLGFGRYGNDELMETLADNGNGNYASIDSVNEAKKVLVEEAGATLVTVAKDVKFQVVFDPAQVESYRLIGYDNRRLAARDFDDDTKDAGEVGPGHSVTALYEIKLAERDAELALLERAELLPSEAPAKIKIRYKAPDADSSVLMEEEAVREIRPLEESSAAHQWAAAVVSFGLRVKGELSPEQVSTAQITALLQPTMKSEPDAYQAEFYSLVKMGESLLK